MPKADIKDKYYYYACPAHSGLHDFSPLTIPDNLYKSQIMKHPKILTFFILLQFQIFSR
jgi:hypothetical protein